MPGATAIRTSGSQNQGTVAPGRLAPSASRAVRPFGRLSSLVRYTGKLHLGQPAGQVEPAVVGDDDDLPPAGLEQPDDALDELPHLARRASSGRFQRLVTELVDVTELGPGPSGWIARLPDREHLVAGVGQQRPQPGHREVGAAGARRRCEDLARTQGSTTGETAGFAVGVIVGRAVSRGSSPTSRPWSRERRLDPPRDVEAASRR